MPVVGVASLLHVRMGWSPWTLTISPSLTPTPPPFLLPPFITPIQPSAPLCPLRLHPSRLTVCQGSWDRGVVAKDGSQEAGEVILLTGRGAANERGRPERQTHVDWSFYPYTLARPSPFNLPYPASPSKSAFLPLPSSLCLPSHPPSLPPSFPTCSLSMGLGKA